MDINNEPRFHALMEEVKFGHTTPEEAAAQINAYFALELERELKAHGIETTVPDAEQRLFRDLEKL